MTIAKLPLAKDITEFTFTGKPINAAVVRDLAGGEFLTHQRNVVLVDGTGKMHLAVAIARASQVRHATLIQRVSFGCRSRVNIPRCLTI